MINKQDIEIIISYMIGELMVGEMVDLCKHCSYKNNCGNKSTCVEGISSFIAKEVNKDVV